MASCNRCGRQVEVNEDGMPLMSTCKCIKSPFDAFLEDCILDCIEGLPSLEVLPPGAASCDACGGEVRLPGFCAACDKEQRA